jgi:hypothetical protein
MKNKLFIIILLFITSKISAQSKEETYKFSKDVETKIEVDTLSLKYQLGATYYSMSGYYKKALEIWDKNGSEIIKITK